MATSTVYRKPGAYAERKDDVGQPATPGAVTDVCIVGEGLNYYTATDEVVTRGASANGTDALTNTGVLSITSIIDEYGVTYQQGSSLDFVKTGNTVDWSPTGTGSLGSPADYTGSTMAAKTHVTRRGGYNLSSDVYLIQSKTVGAAGVGTYDVRSLVEGITATNIASGTTRTDIVPGVQLYVQDTSGTTVANGCSFTTLSGYNANEPDAATKYYATYTYSKADADYAVHTFYKLDDVKTEYGTESDSSISMASRIAFEQNATHVKTLQVQLVGDETVTQIVSKYEEAIDKLKAEDVNVIVPMYYSSTLAAYIKSHCTQMSTKLERKPRICILGMDIGTTTAQFKTQAIALNNLRCVLVAPDGAKKTIDSTQYTLDGTYLAAAIAGLLANPNNDVAKSITYQQINGFDELLSPNLSNLVAEANVLASNGVLIIEEKNGEIKVRHALTTDMASLNNQEVCVVRTADYIKSSMETILEKMYVPSKITTSLPGDIEKTVEILLDSFISAEIIAEKSNISATQNSLEPRSIDVTFKVKPMYPCNWIDISFSLSVM